MTKPTRDIYIYSLPWNPRYLCYALANGYDDPADILARDKTEHPGSCMWPFIQWNTQQWRDWETEFGKVKIKSQEHHDHYDRWLYARALAGECSTTDD